jgi:hypothetical protein
MTKGLTYNSFQTIPNGSPESPPISKCRSAPKSTGMHSMQTIAPITGLRPLIKTFGSSVPSHQRRIHRSVICRDIHIMTVYACVAFDMSYASYVFVMLCRVLFYSVMVCYIMLFCVVLCSILCYLMIWYDILCVGNQTNSYFSYTSRGHDYGRPTGHQLVLADAAVAFAHVLQAGDPFIGTFAWQDVSTVSS